MLTDLILRLMRKKQEAKADVAPTKSVSVKNNGELLNELFSEILPTLDGLKDPIPMQQGSAYASKDLVFSGGVTVDNGTSSAFALSPAAIIEEVAFPTVKQAVIVRINFSYQTSERFLKDPIYLKYFLQKALTYAKVTTDKALNLDSFKPLYGVAYLQYTIPGIKKLIVIEGTSFAGYEFRFHTQCKN